MRSIDSCIVGTLVSALCWGCSSNGEEYEGVPPGSVTNEPVAPAGGAVPSTNENGASSGGPSTSTGAPSTTAGNGTDAPNPSDSVNPQPDTTSDDPIAPTVPASSDDVTGSGNTGPSAEPTTDEPSMVEPTPVDPTPDAPSEPSLIGNVAFSTPSGTFEGELSVTMTSGSDGAEIRYTTDGSLPSADSSLYDGNPLVLTETTQLRALSFLDGAISGLDSTAIYIRRTFDYTSDIPIMIMEGYGAGKPQDKETWVDLAVMTFEPVDGVAALSQNPPTMATRAGYHLRGQSSSSFEKAPYRLELWDNGDNDSDYPLLGMPPEADWAMVGPYTDKTLIRNAFVYSLSRDMGLEAPQLRFAEVFINQDGGPLEESHYEGVYAVTQTIKNQKTRTDLKQLDSNVTTMPEITGGYIFKFDQAAVDEGETVIECTGDDLLMSGGGFGGGGGGDVGSGGTCWSDLELVDPDPVNDEQLAYIEGYVQQFHDALHAEPIADYAQYIDVPSFVDHFIINEITRDVDAYIRSSYYHKDREGPMVAGPIWDYNFALGNVGDALEGWQWEDGRPGTNDWFRILPNDPAFMDQVRARWQELRSTLLSDEQLSARLDAEAAPLMNAGPRDLERWPVGESSFGFGGGGETDQPEDWPGQLNAMRDWIFQRMAWLDGQLL